MNISNNRFNEFLKKLINYKNEKGHTNVPKSYDDIQLVDMVKTVRKYYEQNMLTQDQIDQLNNIGFTWNTSKKSTSINSSWRIFFSKLKLFSKENPQ